MRLDAEVLDRLEATWRRLGVGWVDKMRPGAHERDLDRLEVTFGYAFPVEARHWWGWHDGIEGGDAWIGMGLAWIRAEDAVKIALNNRAVAEEVGADDSRTPSEIWPPSFLPVFTSGRDLVLEASETASGALIYHSFHPDPLTGSEVAPSLGAFLSSLCDLYDSGQQAWNPTEGHWDRHEGPIDVLGV